MSKKNPDNLEFNDGLGDLLREKEGRQFSVRRTVTVLVLFVVVVFFVLFATIKLGTRFLFKAPAAIETVQTDKIDHDALLRELAEMEHLMAEKKGAAVATASATATRSATATAAVSEKEPTRVIPVSKPVVPVTKPAAPVATPAAPAVVPKHLPTAKKVVVKKSPVNAMPHKVIVGTFADLKNADALQRDLKKQGIDAFVWARHVDNREWHAVQAGAFATQESAQLFAAALRKKGYPAYVLYK